MQRDCAAARFIRDHWPALLATAFALPLCLVGAHTVRLDYGPDEPYHMQYIHILAREARIPWPNETHVVQHPPLYYLLMGPAYLASGNAVAPFSLAPGPQRLATMTAAEKRARHICRYLQVTLAIATLWILAALAQEVLPGRPKVHAVALCGLAAWPLFIYMSSVVNNGMLALLWSCVIALVAVRVARADEGDGLRQGALAGVVMGVGLSIKLTTIFAIPAVLALVWARRSNWPQRLRFAAAFIGLCLAVGSCWYLRNVYLYREPFPNFAGPMGNEERLRTAMLLDPFGEGARIVRNALVVLSSATLVPEFSWAQTGFMRISTAQFTVRAVGGALLLIYLVFALRRAGTACARISGPVLTAALVAAVCVVLMVLQFGFIEDYRGITTGGRYVLQAAGWFLVIVLGAGERLAAVLCSRIARTVATAVLLTGSLAGGLVYLYTLVGWYATIHP